MFSELSTEFRGRKVVEFEKSDSWEGPEVAYGLREGYDDEDGTLVGKLAELLKQPGSDQITCLIVGAWGGVCEGDGSEKVVDAFVKVAEQLPMLRHLFFGEMTYEECEISWIKQCDLTPLLNAYPQLKSLRVRGGTSLSFSKTRHDNLEELAIESGGLSRSTLRDIFLCDFPKLEHLELMLGEENYGFDGGVEDLQPLLSGKLFPKLKYMGLMNSAIANEIAAVVVNSPIVDRLDTVDLSCGNLDEEGVKALMGMASHKNLKQLIISHYYCNPVDVERLVRAMPFEVIAEDRQEPEDEWRPILHAE